MMHIYIFGSLCRGEVSVDSDVDLLALVGSRDSRLNKDTFSIYSYDRITELWREGNAFAWHLSLESRFVYSDDGKDFLANLGNPSPYTSGAKDCLRFRELFESSAEAVAAGTPSLVFELSTMFLALRNHATCYSLAMLRTPCFGRHSAVQLGEKSLNVPTYLYRLLERARILSTRGTGEAIPDLDREVLRSDLDVCNDWATMLCAEVTHHG